MPTWEPSEDLAARDLPERLRTKLDLPDDDIVEAYEHAAKHNVLSAINNDVFFGYWSVCADGQDFGFGNTYPSLDGHQMTDALLWLDEAQIVKANWEYVRSFQKPNGQLPIAVLPSLTEVNGAKVDSNGGLYRHWIPGNPLRALGGTTYIQNADVIYHFTQDKGWLDAQLPSVNLAAEFLASLMTPQGRVGGAGYYIERPTRVEYDGVTQCHVVDAFRRVAALNQLIGDMRTANHYEQLADRVQEHFRSKFWAADHFAEYIHPERGVIATHGLTDVDWSAIATGVASPDQEEALWSQLRDEKLFYYGGMPTGIATHPETYEDWEFTHPDRHDVAAMGRAWYLECWARARMGDGAGLVESARQVGNAGREEGYYWRERYQPDGKGGFIAAGARKYCEYPANLIRIVQRFLLGVDFRLDGGLLIAPTVPKEYWNSGFGQTLSWRGQRLSYQMRQRQVTGAFVGTSTQRIHMGYHPETGTPHIEVLVNEKPSEYRKEPRLIIFDLPSQASFNIQFRDAHL